jgi:DNA polymerase
MSARRPVDPRRQALGEVVRLAEEDRRRGVRAWFDPALAEELRAFTKEIETGPARGAAGPSVGPSAAAPAAEASAEIPAPAPVPAADSDAKRPQWGAPPAAEGRDPDWAEQLRALGTEAATCTACGLCSTRTNVVYGVGSARVPLVFVGEAPGRDEDLQGIPFVGRAGQLLTKIIAAIGLDREDVYICNVLKCRPPENRNPAPDEILACRPYLERQLAILRPKVICTLGLFASQLLLDSTAPIGKLRGRLFTQGGWRILPTYHPAALLRNPSLKATVWEDVQLLRRLLDE